MNQNVKSTATQTQAIVLMGVIAGCLLIMSSGCRSLNSTFGSGANDGIQVPRLAFWKKGSSSATPPPPPAHHLDPSSTQAMGQLAANARTATSDIDQSISNLTRSARSQAEKLAATAASRKPYSFDGSGVENAAEALKSKFNTGQNEFGRGLVEAKGKLKSFEPKAIADSRKSFHNQVSSTKQGLDSSFKSAADLRSASNDFKATLVQKNAQLKSDIGAAMNKPFDPAMGKVNKSLYDMKGNLVSGRSSKKAIGGTVDEARERFAAALGTLNGQAAVAAKSSTDLGNGLKDRVAGAAAKLKEPFQGEGVGFKPAFAKSADPVAEQARGLLQQAKQKVAGLGTGFDYPAPLESPAAPTQLGRQLSSMANRTGSFGAAAKSTTAPRPFSGGEFSRTRVAEVTPVNSASTRSATSSSLASTLNKTWSSAARPSQLKPIEAFGNGSTPGNALRTASLQASDASSNAAIPRFGNARNVTVGHVSEIDIPQKVLSGASSYAPGSVNKVR